MQTIVHGGSIAIFLLAGVLWPRRKMPWPARDTIVNVTTGVSLAMLRFTVLALAVHLPAGRCYRFVTVQQPVVQFLIVFLLSDFTRYWVHYLHHRIDFLWRFHRVHHSSEFLDATSGLRMHVIDFLALSMIPVVLFGVLFDCSRFSPVVWIALALTTDAFDAFEHANIRMSLTSPWMARWNLLFNNPVFHGWHHSTDPGEYNGNYGQALTIWDRIFNSHIPHTQPPPEMGLPERDRLLNSALGLQMLQPAPYAPSHEPRSTPPR